MIFSWLLVWRVFQVALVVQNPPASAGDVKRHGFEPWVGQISWRGRWQATPVFLPGESHGRRSLMGYSPWGCKESDMTEHMMCYLSAWTPRERNKRGPQCWGRWSLRPACPKPPHTPAPCGSFFFAPPDSLGSICPCPGSGTSFPVLWWEGVEGTILELCYLGSSPRSCSSGWVTLDESLHFLTSATRVVMAPRSQGSG